VPETTVPAAGESGLLSQVIIQLSVPLSLIALLTGIIAWTESHPPFPGGEIDQQTLRTQEKVEELFEAGRHDRAYIIYRNELAPKGDKYAQYMVGYMHLTGTAVQEDPVTAFAWYRLAAERGGTSISEARDELEGALTSGQIAEADALYQELRKEFSDRVLILRLVKKDLDILRNSAGGGTTLGSANMTIIDRRYGISSGSHYYQMIGKRLDVRLAYLRGQVEVIDVDDEAGKTELAEIESELKEIYALIDSRQ
jgi:TPR repeat protein